MAGVVYTTDVTGLSPAELEGFFVDWPSPPSAERHPEILRGSDRVVLAREGESGRVVGFITAISDGVLSAFIPLPEHQGMGSAASSCGGFSASWRTSTWSTWSATRSSRGTTAASR